MAQVLPFTAPDAAPSGAADAPPRPYLGDVLVRSGHLAPEELDEALSQQQGQDSLLGTILVVQGLISPDALTEALSEQSGLGRINLDASPPDPVLMDAADPYLCLELDAVPWRHYGGRRVIAISNPANGQAAMAAFAGDAERMALAIARPEAIRRAINRHFGGRMRRGCGDALSARNFSCRSLMSHRTSGRKLGGAGGARRRGSRWRPGWRCSWHSAGC